MEKVKKPFYKKWWFWLIVAVVIIAMIVTEDEEETTKDNVEENKEETSKENKKEETAKEEEKVTEEKKEEPVEQAEQEDAEEVEQKEKKIEINKDIEIGNVAIDLRSVTVDDDKLSVFAWWFHGAAREKIHFSVLATISVSQDGEELEIIDGEDTLLRQTDYGVDSNLKLKYQLIDKETPVDIRFRTTTDDPEEETITIELE